MGGFNPSWFVAVGIGVLLVAADTLMPRKRKKKIGHMLLGLGIILIVVGAIKVVYPHQSNIPQQTSTQPKRDLTSQQETPVAPDEDSGHSKSPPKTGKTPPRETAPIQPPQQTISAPNGIAISGGIVTNPTVSNSYGQFPPPGVVPNISICFLKSNVLIGQQYNNVFKMRTDSPISEPTWWFLFDGPVLDVTADADPKPFGYAHGHPPHDKRPNDWQNAIGITVTSIGGMFSQQPWRPEMPLTVTVTSKAQVHLVEVSGRSLDQHIQENFSFRCED